MPRNRDYWKQRSVLLEATQNKEAVEYCAELAREYDKAKIALQKDVNAWYGRLAVNNEITMTEARKLLKADELVEFKWTLQEYIKHGTEYGITGKWAKELENASAKWHISRLESLQIQMHNHVECLYGKVGKSFGEKMRDMYAENYYRMAFEIQRGTNIGKDLMRLDTGMIETVLKKPWAADGKNFSERIWQHRETLVNELQSGIIRNIATGLNPQKLTDHIAKRMNVSKSKAGNLVMTEFAFVSAAATKKSYEDMGVEKYEIVATLDGKTSDICRGLDGKVFDMRDYRPGVTAEPFHARCRSTTAPYFDDEFDDIGERAARDEEGEVYYVPADMTYKEWKKTFATGEQAELEFGIGEAGTKAHDPFNLFTNNNKGNPRYYDFKGKDVHAVEREIAELGYEVAVFFDKGGTAKYCQLGDEDSVQFTRFQIEKMKGMDVTHSHPNSTPPSADDVAVLLKNEANSFRTAGKLGTYVLEYEQVKAAVEDLEEFMDDYAKIVRSLESKYQDAIDSGMEVDIVFYNYGKEVWDNLYDKYGFRPKFEER